MAGLCFLPLLGGHLSILRTGGEVTTMRLFLLTYLLLGVVFTFGFLCVMLTMNDH